MTYQLSDEDNASLTFLRMNGPWTLEPSSRLPPAVIQFSPTSQFLYTGGIEEGAVLMADAGELWHLADLFVCDALKRRIQQAICPATAAAAAQFAVGHGDDELLSACAELMSEMPCQSLEGMDSHVSSGVFIRENMQKKWRKCAVIRQIKSFAFTTSSLDSLESLNAAQTSSRSFAGP